MLGEGVGRGHNGIPSIDSRRNSKGSYQIRYPCFRRMRGRSRMVNPRSDYASRRRWFCRTGKVPTLRVVGVSDEISFNGSIGTSTSGCTRCSKGSPRSN